MCSDSLRFVKVCNLCELMMSLKVSHINNLIYYYTYALYIQLLKKKHVTESNASTLSRMRSHPIITAI